MPLKTIVVPEEITLVDPISKLRIADENGPVAPFTLRTFVNSLLQAASWSENYKSLRSAISIEKAFENAKPGDQVLLSEEDWQKLSAIAENPKDGYAFHSMVMRQLMSFLEALLNPTS